MQASPARGIVKTRHRAPARPNWAIRRHRLQQEERAALGRRVGWAALAVEPGYFDQSHLIKEFRRQIGCSRAEYAAACRQGASVVTRND